MGTKTMRWILVFCPLLAFAQLPEYKKLKSEEYIPEEFLQKSSEKYKAAKAEIEAGDYDRRERKEREAYELQSNFVLDRMLRSGYVFFNDEVSQYLNKVAKVITDANPNLPQDVRIYTLKSSGVNAFATGRGDVCVTVGLLARVKTEAQLALILGHEIIHYANEHSMNLYLDTRGVNRKEAASTSVDQRKVRLDEIDVHRYSRANETEADSLGLMALSKTNYDLSDLIGVFDMLKMTDQPVFNDPFPLASFESEDFQLPANYLMDSIQAFDLDAYDEDDSESTHPNINKRIAATERILSTMDLTVENKSLYVVSQREFGQVKDRALLELSNLLLREGKFNECIYHSTLLLRTYPEYGEYLRANRSKAAYSSILIHSSEYPDLDADTIVGEVMQLHNIENEMSRVEQWGFASRMVCLDYLQNPENEALHRIAQNTLDRVVMNLDNDLSELELADENLADTVSGDYDDSTYFLNFVWTDLLQDEHFVTALDSARANYEALQARKKYHDSAAGRRDRKKRRKLYRRYGIGIPMEKLVVVNPVFMKVDMRKRDGTGVDHLYSEVMAEGLDEMFGEMGERFEYETELLSLSAMNRGDVERFNDYRFLSEWMQEAWSDDGKLKSLGHSFEDVQSIAERYGTNYFLFPTVYSIREKKRGIVPLIALTVFLPYISPITAYYILKNPNYVVFTAYLGNVETGEIKVVKYSVYNARDKRKLLKSHIYDTYWKVNSDKK